MQTSISSSFKRQLNHDKIAGTPSLKVDASQLNHTIVTPHLEQNILKDKNILWCATTQIAWNELCKLNGGRFHLKNEIPMVKILNKRAVTHLQIPEDCYIAMAGFIGDGIFTKIKNALAEKFKGQASPELIPGESGFSPDDWVAYSYLFRNLPYEWAFERLHGGLKFKNVNVEAFGIDQYLAFQENEKKAASQVEIYDFRSEDSFIIKLKTLKKDDELILAKISPKKTLQETIEFVQNRIYDSKPESIHECSDLKIPVLNFDIARTYHELYGNQIKSDNPKFDKKEFAMVKQLIRFKLDEKGAILKSESDFVLGAGGNLLFDKPFLIMIKIKNAYLPYFALWVDNTELLIPVKKN